MGRLFTQHISWTLAKDKKAAQALNLKAIIALKHYQKPFGYL